MTLDEKILTVLKDFIPDERNRLHVYAIISELIKQDNKPSPTEKREDSKGWEEEFDENTNFEGEYLVSWGPEEVKSFISDLLKKQRGEIVERIKKIQVKPKTNSDVVHNALVEIVIKAIEEETI